MEFLAYVGAGFITVLLLLFGLYLTGIIKIEVHEDTE